MMDRRIDAALLVLSSLAARALLGLYVEWKYRTIWDALLLKNAPRPLWSSWHKARRCTWRCVPVPPFS
jgi:hypothetical protein